eukprot:TRINITY_DN7716_c0_g1_i1.p1 TRINITY_DN7716_c0_g1~~TRINITY_DN7716_c0_g1_i1.p1  ORF type:complete len:312 (+),score=75.11 TRINITY_DN7716_c0_g1_i1:70-1005(+)
MGERKVVNKYYPPDFDPSLIPRSKGRGGASVKVRMMLPMSIRCTTCGEYMYRGKKFNSKKETAEGEEYLGIRVFRFYFKCVRCNSDITFKTDPQHGDYMMESGGTRNFEPWKMRDEAEATEKAEREEQENGDVMKQLENKTQANKDQMDMLDQLDELRSLGHRRAGVSNDQLLQQSYAEHEAREKALTAEDEEMVQMIYGKRKQDSDDGGSWESDVSDDTAADSPSAEQPAAKRAAVGSFGDDGAIAPSTKPAAASTGSTFSKLRVVKKDVVAAVAAAPVAKPATAAAAAKPAAPNALSLLNYGDSDESDQ